MKRLLILLLLIPRLAFATVAADDAADRYTGNGTTTAFTYNFKILDQNHISVFLNGVVLVRGTHYSVSGVGSATGSINIFTAPSNGARVALLRNQPVSQLTNYIANEAYNPLRIMGDLDRNTMADQMQQEQIGRAIKFGISSSYTNLSINDPVAGEFLRWKSDLSGIESVGVVSLGAVGATLSTGGVAFASSSSAINTNVSKFAWDDSLFTLSLLGTSRYKMEGGVYTPADPGSNAEFVVMTTGSTKVAGSSQGLRRATWAMFDTNTTDNDNALLKMDILAPTNPSGTYKKTGLHIQAFTLPDNGGDTSGILALQTGGGNAISAYRFTGLRPVGQTEYLNNGYALEIGTDGSTAAMLLHAGWTGVGANVQGMLINMNAGAAKGIVVQPVEPPTFDSRVAFQVAQYVQGNQNANSKWAVTLAGNQTMAGNLIMNGALTMDGAITNFAGITQVGGTNTITATKTVRASGGAADCTLVFVTGILTGGTC